MERSVICRLHLWPRSTRYSSCIIGKPAERHNFYNGFLLTDRINSNVDKQLAMWQTLNPTKWFDGLSRGDTGPTAALAPFHKDTKFTMYTSNDCRDWTKLNYQYDDLENTPRCEFACLVSNNNRS